MDSLVPALIGALVGGSITIAGWFANYRFARKRDEENHRREGTLRHLESLHHLWKDEGVSNLATVIGAGWPRQFNSDFAITLQELRKRYQGNLKQTGRV
jgi:hypothetical protein